MTTLDLYRERVRLRLQARRQEMRATIRTPCQAVIEYRLLLKRLEPPCRGEAENLSTAGIGFYANRPLKKGTHIGIRFDPEEPSEINVPAVVRHSRPVRPGQWMIGCSFSIRLSEEQFDSLAGQRELLCR